MSPVNNLTQEQIEGIQIDYGIVYVDYGEVTQRKLGPTRGGAEFTATKNIRQIDYDGALGRTKGMQVIDAIDALLKTSILDVSQETIALVMPQADLADGVITNNTGGLIPASKYVTNVTMFCKTIGGDYKKITLYNAMSESDFTFAAAPKAEGLVAIEVYAHWDAADQESPLYTIEDVASISEEDAVAPTVATTPDDGDIDVSVAASLVAVFDEAILSGDVTANNFILIKASDGSIVPGALVFGSPNTVTFTPTEALAAEAAYIWLISRIRDLNGNMMEPAVVNFTTVA